MLTHPMLDQLHQLGLSGMAQAFAELEASGEGATLTHADWLALLVDREVTHRRDKRLAARLRYARLRHDAVVEDVDYRIPRARSRAIPQARGRPVDRCARQSHPVRAKRSRFIVPISLSRYKAKVF